MKDKEARSDIDYLKTIIEDLRKARWEQDAKHKALLRVLGLKEEPLYEPYRLTKNPETQESPSNP